MFHQGDLQSGIALAVQQSRLVVCFVRDPTVKSRIWEEKYLKHASVAQPLQDKAVLLRIEAESQEATFLSAFCPITKAPMVVVINCGGRNGQLQEILDAEMTRDELLSRLAAVLEDKPIQAASSSIDSDPASQQAVSESEDPRVDDPPPSSPVSSRTPAQADTSTTVQDLLSDRRNRLEAERKDREAAEKAERIAKAKIRREEAEAEAAKTQSGPYEKKELSYAEQQRKRQRDARQERERILRLVENDKLERKEKEERRKALAREDANGASSTDGFTSVRQPESSKARSVASGESNQCAIQVRLLDGSTIKTRFPVKGTLRTSVRRWVDENRVDGDIPYTFKQILIPLPNRSITISEEEQDLRSLGLAPSATLVMVPIQEYTDAYGSTGQGILSRGLSMGYGVLSSGAGMMTGALRPLLGAAGQTAPTQESERTANPSTVQARPGEPRDDVHRNGLSSVNIRTLQDQRNSHDDQQLYNGNQLNFEPRPNDADKKD